MTNTPPAVTHDLAGVPRDWVDVAIERCVDLIRRYQDVPAGVPVTCLMCDGAAPPECGCDGTMTAADAIAYLEGEIEILCK